MDIGLSLIKHRSPKVAMWLDGVPLVLMAEGRVLEDRLKRARVDLEDILAVARESGLSSLQDVDYVVLESTGEISVIPRSHTKPATTKV